MSLTRKGYIQQLSNGEAGQFAKRSIPYPENEDKLEQWRVDNGSMELVGISQEVAQEFNVSYSEILYALFPNPFVGYSNGVDQGTQETPYLQLVDGSEAGQVSEMVLCQICGSLISCRTILSGRLSSRPER